MSRPHHRRGISQQIPRNVRNKDNFRDISDIKQNYAFSSEHSRSTVLTINKFKEKQKSEVTKQKKMKKQSKTIEIEWRQDEVPYSPEEILNKYSHLLEPIERAQIRQYRNIYFIGRKGKYEEQKSKRKLEKQGFLDYKIGGHIGYRYQVIEKINRGSFGEVLKVFDHKTKQYQALKIVRKMPELVKQTFIQISILTSIKQKDKGDVSGIIRIKDFTIFREHICISFELLDANLYQLLHANQYKGLEESFVRIFSIQILNSLNFLEKMHIIHCDIKPENFVLKVWGKSGIKLIDFGTSCYQDQQVYTYIQSRYYRAPEIIFQKYYTTAIDMWSFGCLIAELCLGKPLFPGNSDLQQLLYIINILGYPDPEFSHKCSLEIERIKQNRYLQKDSNGRVTKDSIERFEKDMSQKLDIQCLIPLEQRFPNEFTSFIHFLRQILKWDPKNRITPAEALQHPWVTCGLPSQIRELYAIYENISQRQDKKMEVIRKKRTKSKSKSKSKEKSQEKNTSNPKTHTKPNKFNVNFYKAESKTLKFDIPHTSAILKTKGSKNSQQKSRTQKPNKSPYSSKKSKV